jgi:phage tail-like protein
VDRYKNFHFRLSWDDRTVAGFGTAGMLTRAPLPRKSKNHNASAVTLERGVTYDAEFLRWANAGWNNGVRPDEATLTHLRSDVLIELYNEAGHAQVVYHLHGCWVSELQVLAVLDSNAGAVAIEHLKLEHQGWARDQLKATPDVRPQ